MRLPRGLSSVNFILFFFLCSATVFALSTWGEDTGEKPLKNAGTADRGLLVASVTFVLVIALLVLLWGFNFSGSENFAFWPWLECSVVLLVPAIARVRWPYFLPAVIVFVIVSLVKIIAYDISGNFFGWMITELLLAGISCHIVYRNEEVTRHQFLTWLRLKNDEKQTREILGHILPKHIVEQVWQAGINLDLVPAQKFDLLSVLVKSPSCFRAAPILRCVLLKVSSL